MFIFSLKRYFLGSTCWKTPGELRERKRETERHTHTHRAERERAETET